MSPQERLPFGADAAPDEQARPVVVYTERRSIMQPRLEAAGTPEAVGVSGGNPSVWRGRLAYAQGRGVAFTANHGSRDLGESEWTLQVAPLDGERPKVMVSGACGFVRPIDPTAHGKGAFWVATGAACDTTRTIFAEADIHYRRPRSASDGT